MERMNDLLLQQFIKPLAELLFPDIGGNSLDHHHVFTVEYAPGEDLYLDMHVDDSEVTVNVNLLDTFEGAGLAFCGRYVDPTHRKLQYTYEHVKGRAVIHSGKHRHGALSITAGRRSNLIVWCRSTFFRKSPAFDIRRSEENQPPDLVCLSRTHDADFQHWSEALGGTGGVENDGSSSHSHGHGHSHSHGHGHSHSHGHGHGHGHGGSNDGTDE